ncbi:hypothetical protein [Prescottella equi]|uniref:Uncharacterized protein n=1 Tax=Prescottella equi ATCC 33707 TaxID=525370 RepID=F1TJQ6_RHOHA|nr:hypothetical protein [Prescottella equi]EGD22360.1 hypothetical protein HMPREF0724_13959 [Prescottella equi ATCC 33707]
MSVQSGAFSARPLIQRIAAGPWPATATLVLASILFGTWSITGRVLTFTPELLIPSAIGLPFGIPPLRLFPLGDTTWTFWFVDVVAALVMIATAWFRLSASRRRPFLAGLLATMLGVAVGNLVRIVYLSFETHQGLGTYVLAVILGLVVSALWGAAVGIVVGLAHLLDDRLRRPVEPVPAKTRAAGRRVRAGSR